MLRKLDFVNAFGRATGVEAWPDLPYGEWNDTLETLHMVAQIVGKVRLSLTPFEPQWANVPLYVTSRGLTTTPMASSGVIFQIDMDLMDHQVIVSTTGGESRRVPLTARPVAAFYAEFMSKLGDLGISAHFQPSPSEVTDPIPFAEDTVHTHYEPEWANRFFTVLTHADLVLKEHRSRFRGRTSPVHFFWGTFDLALTRFSGRPAEPPPNADIIHRLGADAEQICAGFWPGSRQFPRAAFFAYTYPKPDGIEKEAIKPARASWDSSLGEFTFLYDDVRRSASPEAAILDFCEATYAAGARLRDWDPGLVVERPGR